jgi:hypothetical protein
MKSSRTICKPINLIKKLELLFASQKLSRSIDKGDFDGCMKLDEAKPEYKEMIKMFGLPEKCPVGKVSENESSPFYGCCCLNFFTQISKCESGSQKIDINKHKNIFTLARGAPIRTRVLVQHEHVRQTQFMA